MKLFNKKRFSTKIFVTVSLLGAFFLFLLLFLLSFYFNSYLLDSEVEDNVSHNYYDYVDETNPFVTRNPNIAEKITKPIISDNDPIMGDDDSPVTIVQFSDFECGVCFKEAEKIKNLVEGEYKGKIRLIWKDFPVLDINSDSWQASIAGRCAQGQGKFWQYHDLFYQKNQEPNRGLYIDLAREIDLDLDKFLDCYDNSLPEDLVVMNAKEAIDLELPGIPYYYINEQEVLGEISEEDLKRIIDSELKE